MFYKPFPHPLPYFAYSPLLRICCAWVHSYAILCAMLYSIAYTTLSCTLSHVLSCPAPVALPCAVAHMVYYPAYVTLFCS